MHNQRHFREGQMNLKTIQNVGFRLSAMLFGDHGKIVNLLDCFRSFLQSQQNQLCYHVSQCPTPTLTRTPTNKQTHFCRRLYSCVLQARYSKPAVILTSRQSIPRNTFSGCTFQQATRVQSKTTESNLDASFLDQQP